MATRRVLQLARTCRAGFSVASRRPITVGASRLASSWSPAAVGLRRSIVAPAPSLLRAPALFIRRGYAGMDVLVSRRKQ